MALSTWLTFLVASCIIAISPGSGAVLCMSHGLSYGVKRTSGTILGLEVGLLLILVIAGAGVGSLLLASAIAFTVVKFAGALYLIYLGFMQFRAKAAVGPENTPHVLAIGVPSLQRRVLTGFLTNATNPKGIIFMVAVLPQFIAHDAPLPQQLLVMGVTMVTIDLIVMHGYAFAASSMQRFFRDRKMVQRQNRFFGSVLMAVGTALFFVKRSTSA
jgi:homoserine/homoserine lactone efflux protein